METPYWDTSACINFYVKEPDSPDYLRFLFRETATPAVSFLHRLEMLYALLSKERRGELAIGAALELFSHFEKDIQKGRFWLIPWGEDIVQQAAFVANFCLVRPDPIFLRTLDGMHLGALRAAGIKQLVTSDLRMALAATALGLKCLHP